MPLNWEQRKLKKRSQMRFIRARNKGKIFTQRLLKLAEQIDKILNHFITEDGQVKDSAQLQQVLEEYSQLLLPWAEATSIQMISEIDLADKRAWMEHSRTIGRGMRQLIQEAPMQDKLNELKNEQIRLITSIPKDVATRVHQLAVEAVVNGNRSTTLIKEILHSSAVTRNKAKLIARTEVARTTAEINAERAQAVGAETYIWRTSKDSDVRDAHKVLEGKVFRYDEPPIADKSGRRANPGCIYNCRCYAEPIIPD